MRSIGLNIRSFSGSLISYVLLLGFCLLSVSPNAWAALIILSGKEDPKPPATSIILSGQAPEANSSAVGTYANLFDNLWTTHTNGGSQILALGTTSLTAAGIWVDSVVSSMTAANPSVIFAAGSAMDTISFNNAGLIFIPSDTGGGLTGADYGRLNNRGNDFADFLSSGGTLLGLTPGQTGTSGNKGFAYLGPALGSPGGIDVMTTPSNGVLPSGDLFNNVSSTATGAALGISNTNLDSDSWRNVFTTLPGSLEALATADEPLDSGFNGSAAIIGDAPAPVPIPGAMLLFGSGLAALGAWRHRKGKKS